MIMEHLSYNLNFNNTVQSRFSDIKFSDKLRFIDYF